MTHPGQCSAVPSIAGEYDRRMDHDEGATLAPPAPPREGEAPSVSTSSITRAAARSTSAGRRSSGCSRAESSSGSTSTGRRAADFEILRDVFGFHPLAVEDSEQFGQRAKIDEYDDFVFLVVYGAAPDDDRLVEVHCFYSERFLITVHRDDCPAFAEIRRPLREAREADRAPVAAALPHRRRPRRQLLPDPRRLRRPHRRARGQHLPQGRRAPAPGDLPDEAAARRHAQGGHPAARRVRAAHGRRRGAARVRATRTSATSATSTTT